MYESSEWPKVGLFQGKLAHLGNFDECLVVDVYGIKGQHCTIESTYDFEEIGDIKLKHPLDTPNQESSVWVALQMVCTKSSHFFSLEDFSSLSLYSRFWSLRPRLSSISKSLLGVLAVVCIGVQNYL